MSTSIQRLKTQFNAWVAEHFVLGERTLPDELRALEGCHAPLPGSVRGALRFPPRRVSYGGGVRRVMELASAPTPVADDVADANEAATVSTAASVVIGSAAEST